MKKVGVFLKEERVKKKFTLIQMERETKIKKEFIDSIERGEWDKLPEYPIISGFVKTIAKSLDISENATIAILRRDYPFDKNKFSINPKPDVKLKLTVNPKFIIIASSILLIISFLGYLLYQYLQYVSPPKLNIFQPSENQSVSIGELPVSGVTDSDATVMVNNQRVLVTETGEFFDKIEVGENTKEIVFVARSRYGKETAVIRTIVPKKK